MEYYCYITVVFEADTRDFLIWLGHLPPHIGMAWASHHSNKWKKMLRGDANTASWL